MPQSPAELRRPNFDDLNAEIREVMTADNDPPPIDPGFFEDVAPAMQTWMNDGYRRLWREVVLGLKQRGPLTEWVHHTFLQQFVLDRIGQVRRNEELIEDIITSVESLDFMNRDILAVLSSDANASEPAWRGIFVSNDKLRLARRGLSFHRPHHGEFFVFFRDARPAGSTAAGDPSHGHLYTFWGTPNGRAPADIELAVSYVATPDDTGQLYDAADPTQRPMDRIHCGAIKAYVKAKMVERLGLPMDRYLAEFKEEVQVAIGP